MVQKIPTADEMSPILRAGGGRDVKSRMYGRSVLFLGHACDLQEQEL